MANYWHLQKEDGVVVVTVMFGETGLCLAVSIVPGKMTVRIYCKTLIFGGNLILAILVVKAKSAKILIHQYYTQSLSESQRKRRT